TVLYLTEYGQVKVFRVVTPDGDTEHWASNDWAMAPLQRQRWADYRGRIEEYHRGLKQHCGGERCGCARGDGAAQPHRDGDPGVRAAGGLRLPRVDDVAGGEDEHRPPGGRCLPGASLHHPCPSAASPPGAALSTSQVCVTPTVLSVVPFVSFFLAGV